MAAESAVLVGIGTSMASGLLKVALEKCVDSLSKTSTAAGLTSAILGNLKPQLLDLERELSKLHALLCFADGTNPVQNNRNDLVLIWLGSVRDTANFANNVLDEISYDQIRRQVERSSAAKFVCTGSGGSSLLFGAKIGRKIHKFKSMSVKIYKEADEIGIRPAQLLANPSSYQPPAAMCADLREIRENADTSFVVGRQSDEDLIVKKLCEENVQDLGVMALVGMSGVGKTTLTRKIYDDEIVRERYKKKTWIFVSDEFSLTRILDEMLQSLTRVSYNLSNIDAMEGKIRECLDKERFLLVLDDVWNTDRQIWDSIRASLVRVVDGCTGNMVLVTTQSSEVASVMGASLIHPLRVLLTSDARVLFETKAFANKSKEKVSDLRDIGEEILKKCGGLPLAINTLASLLGSMNEISEWESVEKSEIWNMSERQMKIMPWLLLSFNHLPNASVKQCFAHCSIWRRGSIVSETALILRWIAQGFIEQSETSDDMAVVAMGKKYIKVLLANGLLQLIRRNDGFYFFMHDLIHALALYVSRDICLMIGEPNELHKASSRVEHLVISPGNAWSSQLRFPEDSTLSTLRTLICSGVSVSVDLVARARFLRQLELSNCGLKEISSSIGRLKQLRILVLNGNPFAYLPDSMGKLYYLRILDLRSCHMLAELPQTITKLLNLRYILTTQGMHIPKGMGRLKNIRVLPIVKLKAGDGCKIKELGSLLHLEGYLVIKQLENISCKEDATKVGLKMKAGITGLKLFWTSRGQEGDRTCSNDEEIMEELQPHTNLQDLHVESFKGTKFSPWLSNEVDCRNLRDLALVNCRRCEQLPTLGLLPLLKSLLIDGMDNVEVIGRDFFYTSNSGSGNLFPNLVSFELLSMPKMRELFDPSRSCASTFPCLEKLSIVYCPLLVSVPSTFHALKRLTTIGINSQALFTILNSSYNLVSLEVQSVQNLNCLPESLMKCTSIQRLKVVDCKDLVELSSTLQNLHCLQNLIIKDCDSLTSLPSIEGLLSLRWLEIMNCNGIINTPIGLESCVSMETLFLIGCSKMNFIPDLGSLNRLQHLSLVKFSREISVPRWITLLSGLLFLEIGGFYEELVNFCGINLLPNSLRSLSLVGWPKLKSLPIELQSLSQIAKLHLCEFEGVEVLPEWLGNLSSLQALRIHNCKNMKHLPSMNVMKSLTQLNILLIDGCPLLEQRCDKEGCEEWPKISHISNIWINKIRVK